MESARILCRELVHAKKAKERFYISKVQINSTVLALQHQMGSYSYPCHGECTSFSSEHENRPGHSKVN